MPTAQIYGNVLFFHSLQSSGTGLNITGWKMLPSPSTPLYDHYTSITTHRYHGNAILQPILGIKMFPCREIGEKPPGYKIPPFPSSISSSSPLHHYQKSQIFHKRLPKCAANKNSGDQKASNSLSLLTTSKRKPSSLTTQ